MVRISTCTKGNNNIALNSVVQYVSVCGDLRGKETKIKSAKYEPGSFVPYRNNSNALNFVLILMQIQKLAFTYGYNAHLETVRTEATHVL